MKRRVRLPVSLLVPGPLLWLAGVGVALEDVAMIRIALALALVAAAAMIVVTRVAPGGSSRDSSSVSRSSIA